MFRIRRDAESWFRYIGNEEPIKTKFDLYYLCLMLGFGSRRLDDSGELVDVYLRFPQEFSGSRFQVLALLMSAEMQREGLDYSDEQCAQGLVARYLDPADPAALTKDGFARCNSYASGGFNLLASELDQPPRDVHSFLVRYTSLLAR